MAIWRYEQNFNGLNDGDLVGQDNWTEYRETAISALVGNYSPYEGTKCIKISNPELLAYPNNYNWYYQTINCVRGRFHIAVKLNSDDDTDASIDIISDGATVELSVSASVWDGVNVISVFDWYDGGVDTGLRYEDDTWFVLGIDFDNDAGIFYINKDGGDWCGPYYSNGDPENYGNPMTKLGIDGYIRNNTSSVYFDEIKREHFGPFPSSIND